MSDLESDSVEESIDSDEELQEAFAKKNLKPGLNVVTEVIKKEFKNDTAGLKKKLTDIYLDLPWLERLDLTNSLAPLAPEFALYDEINKGSSSKTTIDQDLVHNDFKRELTFYRQAQAAVLEGIPKLHQLKIPTKRPEDYFAQMAKSDEHMKKVREVLLNKEITMERQAKIRKLREMKKYSKKVQQEVLQKRQKEKKEMMSALKKYKKGNIDSLDFLDNNKKSAPQPKKNQQNPRNQKSAKRKTKDAKYGFGGQKKRSKYNTKESVNDVSSFSARKFQNKGKKQTKLKRPGKFTRQKQKNRSKRRN